MKSIYLLILCGVMALSSCQSQRGIEAQGIVSSFVGLNGQPIYLSGRNCTLNQLSAREQGLHAMGSTGGFGLNYKGSSHTPVGSSKQVASVLEKFDFSTQDKPVAILILDDFGKDPTDPASVSTYVLNKELFTFTHSGRIHAAKELAAFVSKQEAKGLNHGALVFNQGIAILDAVSGIRVSSIKDDEVIFKNNGHRIYLRALETNGFDTNEIANELSLAMNDLQAMGVENVAINMSFSIIPCEILDAFRTSPFTSFSRYLQQIVKEGSYASLEDILIEIANLLQGDPLKALTRHSAIGNAIYVASAGNDGLSLPWAPAIWPNVISVGASFVDDPHRLADFSNHGEILAPGAWIKLTDPLKRNGVNQDARELVLAGSSFADLPVSIFSGLDLALPVPQCGLENGEPKLAYNFAGNLSLADAVSNFCP